MEIKNTTRGVVIRLFITGCLAFFIGYSAFAQQTRGLKITNDLRSSSAADFYDNSYAVIVGIDDYQDPNITNLDYASADAKSMQELLTRKFNYKKENVKLFLNEQATRSNIMSSLSAFNDVERNSQVLFYFAGHGETIELPNGGDMGVLLTYDTYIDNLFATGLRMKELSVVSYMVAAKHQLFLVDACYGGLAAAGTRSLSQQSQKYLSNLLRADARQIITAGGKEEKVIEKAEWGHSAFAKVMLDALDKELGDLDKNGLITAEELAVYLKPRVYQHANGRQQPVYQRFTPDEGDFVFVLGDIKAGNSAVNEKFTANNSPENNADRTKSHLGRGDYKEAGKSADNMIDDEPEDPMGYYYKGIVNSDLAQDQSNPADRLGLYRSMNDAFEKAKEMTRYKSSLPEEIQEIDLIKKKIWAKEHNLGIELATNDDIKRTVANPLEKAIAHLKNATTILPDSAYSWNVLGQLYLMRENNTAAMEAISEAFKRMDNPAVDDYVRLGSLYRLENKSEEAITLLEQGKSRYPGNISILQELADSYSVSGKVYQAISVLKELVEMEPRNAQYHLVLGTQYYQIVMHLVNKETLSSAEEKHLDQFTRSTIAELDKAIKYNPNSSVAYNTYGIVYQNKAADLFDKRNKEPEDTKAAELDRQAKEMLMKAMEKYEKAAELDPQNSAYWQSLYQVYTALGMKTKAEEAARKGG